MASDDPNLDDEIFVGPVTQRELIITWRRMRQQRLEKKLEGTEHLKVTSVVEPPSTELTPEELSASCEEESSENTSSTLRTTESGQELKNGGPAASETLFTEDTIQFIEDKENDPAPPSLSETTSSQSQEATAVTCDFQYSRQELENGGPAASETSFTEDTIQFIEDKENDRAPPSLSERTSSLSQEATAVTCDFQYSRQELENGGPAASETLFTEDTIQFIEDKENDPAPPRLSETTSSQSQEATAVTCDFQYSRQELENGGPAASETLFTEDTILFIEDKENDPAPPRLSETTSSQTQEAAAVTCDFQYSCQTPDYGAPAASEKSFTDDMIQFSEDEKNEPSPPRLSETTSSQTQEAAAVETRDSHIPKRSILKPAVLNVNQSSIKTDWAKRINMSKIPLPKRPAYVQPCEK